MNLKPGMYCYHKLSRYLGFGIICEVRGDQSVVKYRAGYTLLKNEYIVAADRIVDLLKDGDFVNEEKVFCVTDDTIVFVDKPYIRRNKDVYNAFIEDVLPKESYDKFAVKLSDFKNWQEQLELDKEKAINDELQARNELE